MPTFDEILEGKTERRIYPFDAPWKQAAWFLDGIRAEALTTMRAKPSKIVRPPIN
jgi:hypothetical protein